MGLEKVVVGDNFRLRDLGLREMGLLSWEHRSSPWLADGGQTCPVSPRHWACNSTGGHQVSMVSLGQLC